MNEEQIKEARLTFAEALAESPIASDPTQSARVHAGSRVLFGALEGGLDEAGLVILEITVEAVCEMFQEHISPEQAAHKVKRLQLLGVSAEKINESLLLVPAIFEAMEQAG